MNLGPAGPAHVTAMMSGVARADLDGARARSTRTVEPARGPGGAGILRMTAAPGWPVRGALALLAGYQRWLSPLLPGACRFWPTCSEYARLALLRHGLVRGGGLALWRFCRCHPYARGGIDPPP